MKSRFFFVISTVIILCIVITTCTTPNNSKVKPSTIDQALASAKADAAALSEADYTPATWATLTTALALPETNDTEKQAKTTAINDAIAGLVKVSEAQAAVTKAKTDASKLIEYDYTPDSWDLLEDALELPETNDTEKQAKADAINLAIDGLVILTASDRLTNAKSIALALTQADYTSDTWSTLTTALALLETTDTEKQAKTTAITNAIAGLITVIDDGLVTAKSTALALTQANYTPDTWSTLIAALALPETNDTEKQTKTTAIYNAIAGLVSLQAVQIAELIVFGGFQGIDLITSGFILPSTMTGASLSWESTNTDIISITGGFGVPNNSTLEQETIVLLKATVSPDDGSAPYTVDVPFTVQSSADTYNEAITKAADRINELFAQEKGIDFAEGEDKDNVKNDFELPSSGPFNTSISWVADPATGEVVFGANDNGKYPVIVSPGDVEKTITLTGTISKGDGTTQTVTKVIKVQPLTETEQVEKVANDFDINEHFIGPDNTDTQDSVTKNFGLPATGDYDIHITYVSDKPSILTIEADIGGSYPVTVTRPTTADEVVTITATFIKGAITRTLEIPVTVKQKTYAPKETGPAGGKIFYVNPNAATDGWTYLEIAPADAESFQVTWDSGYFTRNLNIGTGTAIGTGRTNTLYIVDKLTSTSPNVTGQAAQKCDDYSVNDYTDWFMPSKDEIQLWTNIFTPAEQSALGIYAKTYWTSSEQVGDAILRAYRHDVTGNETTTMDKNNTLWVRAIRKF